MHRRTASSPAKLPAAQSPESTTGMTMKSPPLKAACAPTSTTRTEKTRACDETTFDQIQDEEDIFGAGNDDNITLALTMSITIGDDAEICMQSIGAISKAKSPLSS